ncbi:chromosome segregation protein [Bacillus phage vB_BpsS-140]|nr:chromosome segregation protein [Bacillus phage vB_BpsS-140]
MEFLIYNRDEELITKISDNDLHEAYDIEAKNAEILFQFVMYNTPKSEMIKEGHMIAFHDEMEGGFKLFEIMLIEDIHDDNSTMKEVTCEHCSNELLDEFVHDLRPTNRSAEYALGQVLANTRWEVGQVADLGLRSTNFYRQHVLDSIVRILNVWGGELRYRVTIDNEYNITNRYVDILPRRGSDTGKRFEFDKHNIEVKRTVDISHLKTALRGYGKGEELENSESDNAYGRRIDFSDVEWKVSNGDPIDKPLGQDFVGLPSAQEAWGRLNPDGSRRHRYGIFEDQDEENPEKLLWNTWDALQQQCNPITSYSGKVIDFFRLDETQVHEKVVLGDGVILIDDDMTPRILESARVIYLKRDLLRTGNDEVIIGQFSPIGSELDEIRETVKKIKDRSAIWDIDKDVILTPENYPNTVPSVPTNFEADGGVYSIQIYWDYAFNELYVATYELYASEIPEFTINPNNLIYRGKNNAYVHETGSNKRFYYRMRAVNYHGRASAFTGEISAETARVKTDDILFGEELAERLRELNKVADIIGVDGIDFDNIKQEVFDQIQQDSKAYTDKEIQDLTDDLMSELADKAGLEYVDGKLGFIEDDMKFLDGKIEQLQLDAVDLMDRSNQLFDDISLLNNRADSIVGDVNRIEDAIADVSGNLSDIEDTLLQRIEENKDLLDQHGGKITTMTQEIDTLEGTINTTIDKLSNVEGQVQNQQVQIIANTEAITLKANQSDLDTVTGDISNMSSQLSVQAELISGKAEQSSVTTLQNGMTSITNRVGTLELSSSGFSTSISKLEKDFDDLEISNRNRFIGSSEQFNSAMWTSWNYFPPPSQAIPVAVGTPYTASVYYDDIVSDNPIGIRIFWYNDSGALVQESPNGTSLNQGESGYAEITRIAPIGVSFARVVLRRYVYAGTSTAKYKEVQFVRGNKRPDWSPAIEDVDDKISTISESVSSINQTVDSITQSVSSLSSTTTSQGSQITSINTELSVLGDRINAKAEKTVVNTLAGDITNVTSQVATLQLSVDGFSTTVSSLQSDLDNLEIGGRNLLKNSRTIIQRSNNGALYPIISNLMTEGNMEFYRTRRLDKTLNPTVFSTYNQLWVSNFIRELKGETITVSAKFRTSSERNVNMICSFRGNDQPNYTPVPNVSLTVDGNWQTHSVTFEVTDEIMKYSFLYFGAMTITPFTEDDVEEFYLDSCEYKVELGKKATDWSPAIEDVDDQITTVNNRVSTFEQTVDSIVANISSLTSEINGNSGSIHSINTELGIMNGKINAKAEQSTVTTINNNVTNITSRVGTLELSSTGFNTKITALESQMDNVSNVINLVNNISKSGNNDRWTPLSSGTLTIVNKDFNGETIPVQRARTDANMHSVSDYFEVDPTKTYKVSIWLRRDDPQGAGTALTDYFGIYAQNSSTTSTASIATINISSLEVTSSPNPYFYSSRLPSGQWIKKVAYIFANGTPVEECKGLGEGVSHAMRMTPLTKRIRIRYLNWANEGTSSDLFMAHPSVVEVNDIAKSNGQINSVQEYASSIDQKADQIQLSVTQMGTHVDDRFTSVNTSLSLMNDQIQAKAEKTEITSIDGKISTLTTAVGMLTVSSEGFNTSISRIQADIDDMEIGTTNLQVGSSRDFKTATWDTWNYFPPPSQSMIVDSGQTYTASIYYDVTNSPVQVGIRIFWYNMGTLIQESANGTGLNQGQKGIVHVTATAPANANRARVVMRKFNSSGISTVQYKEIMFTKGNKLASWSANIEDVIDSALSPLQSRITSAESSINQQANQIALRATTTTVDVLTGRVTTTEGLIDLMSDQIALRVEKNKIVSEININPEGIRISGALIQITGTTLINNAVIKSAHIESGAVGTLAIANAAITRAKLETAIISSAYIQDLAVTTAKIGSLAVDSAKIASLAVTTAKIADLAITNAKIANATIQSAKIANLDVDKLTGNIATFARTSWNTISSQVTMTASGMETYSGGSRTSLVNGNGHTFYRNNLTMGAIGASNWINDTNYRGLSFRLENNADYMAWTFRLNASDPNPTTRFEWHKTDAKVEEAGFRFSDRVRINDHLTVDSTKVIYARTISTTNYLSGNRHLRFENYTFNGQDGVRIVRGAKGNGAALHLTGSSAYLMSSGNAYLRISQDGNGNFIQSVDFYNRTYSSAPNVHVTSLGTLGRSTSASKYKINIDLVDNDYLEDKILSLSTKSWYDKATAEGHAKFVEAYNSGRETEIDLDDLPPLKRHYGFIAEDLADNGLEMFVQRSGDGEIEGIEYDRLAVMTIPIIKKQKQGLDTLELKNQLLEDRVKQLEEKIL